MAEKLSISSPNGKESKIRAKLHQSYPLSSILIYELSTILHFLIGGLALILGYSFLWWGDLIGLIYLIFAFLQMYILMPLTVCPNCVYYRMENACCVSGLNKISRKLAREGKPENFPKRAGGLFCYNNIYMIALFFPILATIPAIFLNFSYVLLTFFLIVVGLLVFRFFVIFPKVACLHCMAKYTCPVGEQIGVRDQ